MVGDFLRFKIDDQRCESMQPRNLAWLLQMLQPALQDAAPQAKLKVIVAPTQVGAMAKACGNRVVFDAYRDDATQAWARLYDAATPPAFLSLFDRLLAVDLVIGFELPPLTKRFLHAAGKPYLNLFVHPLRFLRDLCLGATTNSPRILSSLQHCVVHPDEVRHQASRYKAYFRRRQLERLAIPAGLPVLIGQTERDSVLITSKGEFDTWGAHRDELRESLSGTDALVFLEHPMCPSSAMAIQEIRAATNKTVIATNANGYGLLMSNPDIPFVVTLSSSLGVEAQTLGLDACFLLADPRDKFVIPGLDLSLREPLGHRLLRKAFWQEVLTGSAATKAPVSSDAFALGDGYVRNSLETWAYSGLQNGLEGVVVRKTFAVSHNLSRTRHYQLLAGVLDYVPGDGVAQGQAMQQTSQDGILLESIPPPLTIGSKQEVRVDLPTAVATLIKGFHSPEPWGCWTSGLESIILLPVTSEAVKQGSVLHVSMCLRLYEGLAQECPVLRISAEGEPLGFAFFRPGATRIEVQVIVPAVAPLIRLRMELSCVNTPAAHGNSLDTRWLGVGVESLIIQCTHEPQTTQDSNQVANRTWGLGLGPSHASP